MKRARMHSVFEVSLFRLMEYGNVARRRNARGGKNAHALAQHFITQGARIRLQDRTCSVRALEAFPY